MRLVACLVVVLAGCSGSRAAPDATTGGACTTSGRTVIESLSARPSALVVRGEWVYVAPGIEDGGGIHRVPIAGGEPQRITNLPVTDFDANADGAVAFLTNGEIRVHDADGALEVVGPPSGTQSIDAIAIDAAGNAFFRATDAKGKYIGRWSVRRKGIDVLFRDKIWVGPFVHDGDAVAWVATFGTGGSLALYGEDVAGGSPDIEPNVPAESTIVGVDPKNLYFTKNEEPTVIRAAARTSGQSSPFSVASSARATRFAVDDTWVWWTVKDLETTAVAIWRAPKTGGAAESFTSAPTGALLSVDGCRLVWVDQASPSWTVVSEAK